ncbi:MAG: CoA-binding protein [archaeon]|nr:CoA-binding protein [archaeon]
MKRGLKSFFEPKSIAVIGASEHAEKVGNSLIKNLMNYNGKVIPVNPKHDLIMGKKCFHSVKDYDEKIDLAIIAIPSPFVIDVVKECAEKGIKDIIVISAGFSEMGNVKLENNLTNICKKYSINLLGPNCFGVANPYKNLDVTFSKTSAQKGDVAFISQSGALWSYVSDYSIDKMGFSGFVSLGNMADLNFSDFIEYFNQDKNTKIIILYMERLKDGKKFIEICKKSNKTIIVVKSGKSEKGSKAAISHTGSLATNFKIYQGIFKQAGVKSADCLFSALNFARMKIKPQGKKVVIITNAGGAGALETDSCFEKGLEIVDLPEKFKLNNPIDLLGTASAEDYEKMLDKLKNEKFYNSVIVLLTPQKMTQPEKTAEAIVKFSKSKPIVACFLGGETLKKARKILEDNDVPCFEQIGQAAEVLKIA